jgi:hypothetical protein
MDMLRFFLDLYDRCQSDYSDLNIAILDANESDLVAIAQGARRQILHLYGGKVDLDRRVDTSALVSRWEAGHGSLAPYHLLSGLDELLADVRLEVQERALETLSRERRAVIPNSFRLHALGNVYVAHRVQENICRHLNEFRVAVSTERARINYVPIGRDCPTALREEWGALNDSLAGSRKGPCLRVVCANFSRKPADFRICAQRARGGWAEDFGTTFWFDQVNPVELDKLRTELKKILQHCREIEAQVLVLPELTMPEELVAELVAELEEHWEERPFPTLTIGGSWHIRQDGKRLNRAPIFFGPRRMEVSADKLYRFTMTPSEVREFIAHVRVDGEVDPRRSASEEIALGNSVLILDTDAGRLAVGICIDAIMSELKHTLETLGVNYLFVPARSKTGERFMLDLKTFCEHCAAFFCFANTPSAVKDGDIGSFILFPTRPTYVASAGKVPASGRAICACEERHAVLEPADFYGPE